MSLLYGSTVASPASSEWESTIDTPPTTPSDHGLEKDVDILDIAALQSRARFNFWRPSYHLQPTEGGWMNDPCGPGYDPATKLYHVSFQYNPRGNDWGNMSWLSATSPDMMNWTIKPSPMISPDQPYDKEGAFTGCLTPGNDGSLHCFYTSVISLPIHWTLPHPRGCEGLSMATSRDGGRSWTKSKNNPILASEPKGFDVTGWRDPYVGTWPRMSRMLNQESETTPFGIISGGIRDVGPTSFLYSIKAEDHAQWDFISAIIDPGIADGSSRWCGQLGSNWECTNFLSLRDDQDDSVEQDFLILGTEGYEPPTGEATKATSTEGPQRPSRAQLWAAISPQKDPCGKISFNISYTGYLDHGCLYAANSFHDPVSGRQVFYGWITEDDLSDELRHAQCWSGLLSLPRELRIQTLYNVVGTCASELTDIRSVEVGIHEEGTYRVRTLATQPCPGVVEALRSGTNVQQRSLGRCMLREAYSLTSGSPHPAIPLNSVQWELNCSFRVSSNCIKAGFRIRHSTTQSTILGFDPTSESFTIQRPSLPCSHSDRLVNSRLETATHTLFNVRDPKTDATEMETLDLRVWRDNSVLEVFVNGRTAISTRLYTIEDERGELEFFAVDAGAEVTELLYAHVWDGIGILGP